MSETSTVGNRVRDLRVNAGLTKVKLAKLCGCSMPSIVNIENGRTQQIRYWLLEALAKNLGSTPQWIAYGSGPKDQASKTDQSNGDGSVLLLRTDYATEVFANEDGGVTIRQERSDGEFDVVAFSPERSRVVASKLIALADFIEAEDGQ